MGGRGDFFYSRIKELYAKFTQAISLYRRMGARENERGEGEEEEVCVYIDVRVISCYDGMVL